MIYYQKINNTRFIRRLWHRQIVDIDSLFDTVVTYERAAARQQGACLALAVFHRDRRRQHRRSFPAKAQTSDTPLLTLLKASSAMPLLYNGVVNVNERECFDGGLINPIPILDAIEAGCTWISWSLTRPANCESRPTMLEQRLSKYVALAEERILLLRSRMRVSAPTTFRDIALARQSVPSGINIVTICPDETDPRIERTTRSRNAEGRGHCDRAPHFPNIRPTDGRTLLKFASIPVLVEVPRRRK